MKALSLKSGLKEVKSVYVFSGQDRFLFFYALNRLKLILTPTFPDINYLTLDFNLLTPQSLYETIEALPFADAYRLILIENVKANNNGNANIFKILESHAQKTDFNTVIALSSDAELSIKGAEVIDCSHLNEAELKIFIQNKINKNGGKISNEAISALIDYTLNDLTRIDIELDKLLSYKPKEEIVLSDIGSLVTKDKEYQVFELANIIAKGDKNKCIEMITSLSASEKSVFWIISPLYNTYRRALFVSIHKNMTDSELAKLLQIKEFAVKMLRVQVNTFSPRTLKYYMDKLYFLECDIKNGRIKEDVGLIEVVINILLKRN